jgi:hypothetical protein
MIGAVIFGVRTVLDTSPQFQPVAWWYTRKQLGRGLRECYDAPEDLPIRLIVLIKTLDQTLSTQAADQPKAESQRAPNDGRLRGSALRWHCNRPLWQF